MDDNLAEREKWKLFAGRVTLTFPFRVDVQIGVYADGNPDMSVVLHVLDRDTREPITVRTRRPCPPWSGDEAAIELLFELLDIAFRHEIYESVRIDEKLARPLHTGGTNG